VAVSFFTTVLTTAKKASTVTGVFVSVILAQWAVETGRGTSTAFVKGNNYAGVSASGSVTYFPNRTAGLTAYMRTMKQTTYEAVRAASTWQAACVALGNSPWAGSRYAGGAVTGGGPGSLLITVIENTNLTQYDTGGSKAGTTGGGSAGTPSKVSTTSATFHNAYKQIQPPVPGFVSTAALEQVFINGTSAALICKGCLVTVQLDLALTKISALCLTIHDPDAKIINAPELSQISTVTFGPYTFTLVAIEKQDSVLTVTFQPWGVSALQKATGAFTVPAGIMTRSEFAELLVSQVDGLNFTQAPTTYLYGLDKGYAHTTKEQLCRGTVNSPLENSWTCLQRLANEIQWVCFESFGTVYFGPYDWLINLPPVLTPRQFTDGITWINGTYDVGQPLGDLTISAVADSWTATPGQCVAITNLGPFNGNWIVSEMEREDILEPTITISLQQPLPGLPEPSSGGTNPAVGSGAGSAQSTAGSVAAQKALAFAESKVGDAYSETTGRRLGPTSYDCSGLVYEAYQAAGIQIGGPHHTTYTMWPTNAGTPVPPGANNFRPGDLMFFAGSTGGAASHVAMVVKVNKGTGSVHVVQAADPTQGVCYATSTPHIGTAYGSTLVYIGATRPAP
jgi:cell wall-associated NlpC family hydrolase